METNDVKNASENVSRTTLSNREYRLREASALYKYVIRSADKGMGYLSHIMRKPGVCICENKEADQLCGNRLADQRLCFRYIDSKIPFHSESKTQVSSHPLWLYSPVRVGPSRKPGKQVLL